MECCVFGWSQQEGGQPKADIINSVRPSSFWAWSALHSLWAKVTDCSTKTNKKQTCQSSGGGVRSSQAWLTVGTELSWHSGAPTGVSVRARLRGTVDQWEGRTQARVCVASYDWIEREEAGPVSNSCHAHVEEEEEWCGVRILTDVTWTRENIHRDINI